MGIKKYALYFFGFFACFGLFGIIYAMNGGGDDGLLPLSIGMSAVSLLCLIFVFSKDLIAFGKIHKIKFIFIIVLFLSAFVSILVGPRIYPKLALTHQIRQICNAYGVEPTKITLNKTFGYEEYLTARIYVNDFSDFTHEQYVSFWDEINDCETKTAEIFDLTISSDGKEYTVDYISTNGNSTPVVYIDGQPMLKKYTPIECSFCYGTGRAKCGSCNGKGKKLVEWYSEGDWGFTSYTNYDCPSCDGRGHVDCYHCGGEGEYYNTSQ